MPNAACHACFLLIFCEAQAARWWAAMRERRARIVLGLRSFSNAYSYWTAAAARAAAVDC